MGKGSVAVVCIALGANIAFAVAHLVAQLRLHTALGHMSHGEPVLRAEMWVGNFSGVQVAAFAGAGILFVLWFMQAWDRADSPRPSRRWWQRRKWALASWFIPILNLGVPLLIALDMWASSQPEETDRRHSRLWVIGWWISFVLWTITNRWAQTLYRQAEQVQPVRDALRVGMLTDVLGVLAAIAAIAFVLQLSRSQIARERQDSSTFRPVPA
ncbi:DUF4328 domain-containing protein [Streptomyces sp. V1I1]|uniref:DUF4328 domain-containing protein n=1 Tax=Streptomyces sp. V1I1 TaxID=3042272 RepID=UPI002781C1F1|nr:DUF4328 domain-containing protein [Streptomyces sp. V1I1]MDQ0938417.1 hypothetical protein [Streptomyces sp. V1I1]